MDLFTNRLNIQSNKKVKKPIDADVVEWLKPLAEELEIDVEEIALNLHSQKIYVFDDIEDILGIDEIESIEE